MSKQRLMLYGEKTVLLKSRRVPESKKEELENIIDDFLLKCVKPGYVGVAKSKDSKKGFEKSEKYLVDESMVVPKQEKSPKKIEPQVVEDKEEVELDLQYDKDYAEYEKDGYEKLSTFPLGSDKIKMYCGYPVFFDGTYYYTKYVEKNKGVVIVKFKKEQHVEFFILDELPRKTK